MRKTISIFILPLVIVFASSCSPYKYFIDHGHYDVSVVPKEYNPQKHILLVPEIPRLNNSKETNEKVTKKLDEALTEKYPYKHLVVPLADILSNKKYSDTSVYRFALLVDMEIVTSTTTTTVYQGENKTSVSPSARTARLDFKFLDRSSKKEYPVTGNRSPYLNYVAGALGELISRAKH